MKKAGRGSMDYKSDMDRYTMDYKSKWLDNSCVHIATNFVGIDPLGKIERWCTDDKVRKQIQSPRIILFYNEGREVWIFVTCCSAFIASLSRPEDGT